MKNHIDKIAVIFITSIFALTGITTGYAMWNQELTMDAAITTGTLDWEWLKILDELDSSCPPPYYPTQDPDLNVDPNLGFDGSFAEPTDKNVGCADLYWIDQYTLGFDIFNAYPGYVNGASTHLHCLGTIPMKIESLILSFNADLSNPFAQIYNLQDEIIDIDLNQDGQIDCQIYWLDDYFGYQLEPCNVLEISFWICFLQPLEQNTTFTFYLGLRAVQWNEYNPPQIIYKH